MSGVGFNAKIEGFAEIERALQQFATKVQGNVMRAALGAGANVFRTEARRMVPKDTGALYRSIRVSRRLNKRTGQPEATVKAGSRVKGGAKEKGAARGAFYAHMVEFGTKKHLIKARRAKALKLRGGKFAEEVEHPGAKALPFMRPAFDRNWRRAVEATAAQARKRIAREAVKR